MELRIDLSDRADMEAAFALLATVLAVTDPTGEPIRITSTPMATPPAHLLEGTQDGAVGNGVPSTVDAAALPNVPEGLLAGGQSDTSGSTSTGAATDQQPAGAPPAPAPAASPAPAGVQLDKEGIPHDARIHSNPPSINKGDGLWRAKKGLNDAALVNSVKAELKALMSIPPAGGTAVAPPAAASAPTTPPVGTAPPVPQAAAPSAPDVPPATVAAPTTPQELIPRVTAANASGLLPQSALLDACTAYGLPTIPALFQRPDKVGEVYAYLTMAYPGFQ